MNWKEFLKPKFNKIAFMLILGLFLMFIELPVSSSIEIFSNGNPFLFSSISPLPWILLLPTLIFTGTSDLLSVYYWAPTVIGLFVWYLISALLTMLIEPKIKLSKTREYELKIASIIVIIIGLLIAFPFTGAFFATH